MTFDETRPYRADLDVRDWDPLCHTLRHDLPNGLLRPLIGARRAGKTWALCALKQRLSDLRPEIIDLRSPDFLAKLRRPPRLSRLLLLDEPGLALKSENIRSFLDACATNHQSGRTVLVAMTPGEWARLKPAGTAAQVQTRDLRFIPPLTETQAERLAARASWATELLSQLPSSWQRHPFALELLLKMGDASPGARLNPTQLAMSAAEHSNSFPTSYAHSVFREGLSDSQQSLVRQVVRYGAPAAHDDLELLLSCGLLSVVSSGMRLDDPLLAAWMPPPLVLHHVSDVHFGRFAADPVDRKDSSQAGKRLATAIGAQKVAHAYADHVKAGCGYAPHILIVSGDLAEWALPEEFAEARGWLDGIRDALSGRPHPMLGTEPRILITGGNHDVDRSAPQEPSTERHKAFANAFEGYLHPSCEIDPETRPLATQCYPGIGIEVVLLGSAELGQELDRGEVVKDLESIVASLLSKARDAFGRQDIENYERIRAQLEYIDPSIIHRKTIERLSSFKFRTSVRIAVLHHPISPVPGSLSNARHGTLLNAGDLKLTLFDKGFCLVLHGHEHTGFLSVENWPHMKGSVPLHILSAPSLGSTQVGESRGFNQIRVFREGADGYEIEVRRYVQSGDRWQPDGDPISFTLQG